VAAPPASAGHAEAPRAETRGAHAHGHSHGEKRGAAHAAAEAAPPAAVKHDKPGFFRRLGRLFKRS
jgi:hypothetical protein